MLNKKRLDRNVKWLESERVRLRQELSTVKPTLAEGDRPGLGTHMAEHATEVSEQAVNQAVRRRLRHTLELVNRALEKIDQGTYRVCDRCDGPIDPARLKAHPCATLCMSCQKQAERETSPR